MKPKFLKRVGAMLTPQENDWIKTTALDRCCACEAESPARDKFCRRCGARRTDGFATRTDLIYSARCETRPMATSLGDYPTYSAQLIRIVTRSLSARAAAEQPGRGLRWLICTLVAIPIWMLIVMLSPLDAYTAAKAAARCATERTGDALGERHTQAY